MHKSSYLVGVLSLALIGLSLVDCGSEVGRSTVSKDGETTTIIESTDAIKPQKGAAKLEKTLENFEGYGWFNGATLVGYQYAKSVFGDDRGIAYLNIESGNVEYFKAFSSKPQMTGLSLDGTRLALVKEGSGRNNPLVILDLAQQHVTHYKSSMIFTPWQFNWFEDGSGGTLTPIDSSQNRLSLVGADGKMTEMDLTYSPKKSQGESYISLGTGLGKRGEDIYFLVYSDDPGIYKYNLKAQVSSQVLAQETVSQFAIAHQQGYMAIASFKKSGTGSELLVYNLAGKQIYELHKALNFNRIIWSADGNALVFEAIESSGESSLYLANMQTGQTHFLGSYKGYSIKQLALNPEGNQLMVSFVNHMAETERIDTQVLGLSQ